MLSKHKKILICNIVNICTVTLFIFPIKVLAIVNMDALSFGNVKDTFVADMDLAISGASGNN